MKTKKTAIPRLTVIVPFMNEEKYIGECIKSLLNQNTSIQYELVFVDNSSTDRSNIIANNLLRKNIDRVVSEKIANPYIARNTGIKHAKGSYVAFTDAHCTVHKSWIDNINKTMSIFKIVVGKRVFPSNNIGVKLLEEFENYKTEYVTNNYDRPYHFGFTNNMVLAKKHFDEYGYFAPQKYSGDVEFIQRVLEKSRNVSVQYNTEMIVTHNKIKSSITWVKKFYYYGIGGDDLSNSSQFKKLTSLQNFDIFIKLSRKYPFSKQFYLFVLLVSKSLFYKLGSLSKSIIR